MGGLEGITSIGQQQSADVSDGIAMPENIQVIYMRYLFMWEAIG
jgi:hypothetical protein